MSHSNQSLVLRCVLSASLWCAIVSLPLLPSATEWTLPQRLSSMRCASRDESNKCNVDVMSESGLRARTGAHFQSATSSTGAGSTVVPSTTAGGLRLAFEAAFFGFTAGAMELPRCLSLLERVELISPFFLPCSFPSSHSPCSPSQPPLAPSGQLCNELAVDCLLPRLCSRRRYDAQ